MFHGLYCGGFVGDCGTSLKHSVKGVSRPMGTNLMVTLLPLGESVSLSLYFTLLSGVGPTYS